MDLTSLCDLWNYQHTEYRFTNFLKERIDGYDNGKVYNVEAAKKEREEWLSKIKYGNKEANPELDKIKKEYLDRLLHPENVYMKKKLEWETQVERYGANDPLLKTYECAAKYNLLPNQVNFKLFLEYEGVKEKEKRLHTNFIQDFHR